MRTLKFIIEGLSIKQDPTCNFSGIVPGTKGYLKAEFRFDKDWSGSKQMAIFSSINGARVPMRIINSSCVIPEEVLTRRSFNLTVVGLKPDVKLVTNKLEVKQDG